MLVKYASERGIYAYLRNMFCAAEKKGENGAYKGVSLGD
jgi:hypothetical protein